MATRTITIRVNEDAAQAYEAASAEERRKFDALLSLRLEEAASPTRPLEEVLDDLSRKAQERGLTAELLEELLKDP